MHVFKLPSKGTWYGKLDELRMAGLTIGQAVEIEKCMKIENDSDRLTQFCAIIERSISGINAMDLTVPDFYSLCFELRLISSNDPIFLEKKVNGNTFKKNIFKESFTLLDFSFNKNFLKYDFPRIRDRIYILSQKNDKELSSIERTFFGYVKGSTPEEKIKNFKSMSYDELTELIVYTSKVNHGYSPIVKVFNSDGSSEDMEVSFNPEMLLPRCLLEIIYSNNI
jgi:hypothetical protein